MSGPTRLGSSHGVYGGLAKYGLVFGLKYSQPPQKLQMNKSMRSDLVNVFSATRGIWTVIDEAGGNFTSIINVISHPQAESII